MVNEQINCKQGRFMIGDKRSILVRFSCSEASMGYSSPVCEQLPEQIFQQFKNVSQVQIPSYVQNIIKIFRESRQISANKW